MADVTLTITLSDIEAHALAIVIASLGPEQYEHAYQHWLNHWKANDARRGQHVRPHGRRSQETLRGAR
jgi:hypothetical protein